MRRSALSRSPRRRRCSGGPRTRHRRSPSAHPRQSEPCERPWPESIRLLPRTAPNPLHVLLRHRLLPQPGGFDGRALVVELANPHDHPVPDREQLVLGRANLGPPLGPAPPLGCLDEHLPAAAVGHPLDLPSVVIEVFEPLLEPLSDALTASIG